MQELDDPTTIESAIIRGYVEQWHKDGGKDRPVELQAAFVARGAIIGFKLGLLVGTTVTALIALSLKAFF